MESVTWQSLIRTSSTIEIKSCKSPLLRPGRFTMSLPTLHIQLTSMEEVWVTSWSRLVSQQIIPWRLNYRDTRCLKKNQVMVKCYWRLYQNMASGIYSTWVDTRSQAKSKHYEPTLILYLSLYIPVFYVEF